MKGTIFNKGLAFFGVFAAVLLVLAACRPAVSPGAAPREIQQGAGLTEEVAPFGELDQIEAAALAPAVTLSADDQAIAEATTLEDFLGRQLDSVRIPAIESEIFGIDSAPVEVQLEEHMVTEFSTARLNIDEELSGVALAPRDGWFEEHMVTEFPSGVVTLDEEILSAMLAAPVAVEGLAPVAEEGALIDEGQLSDQMITNFSTARVSIDDELADVGLVSRDGWFEEHMVTEFAKGVVAIDDERLLGEELSGGATDEGLAMTGAAIQDMTADYSGDAVMDGYSY